jgi:hypothetical protein
MPRRWGDDMRVSQRCDLGKNGDTFAVDRGETSGEFHNSGVGIRHLRSRNNRCSGNKPDLLAHSISNAISSEVSR